jgi:TPR repeat protein
MLKYFFVFLTSFLFLSATNINNINKSAINAYKNGNYKLAYKLWNKACQKGNLAACNNEAMLIYLKATKLNENQAKAVKILSNSLKKDNNNTTIMYNLATMYFNGYFDKKNQKIIFKRKDALKLFKKCMNLGDKRCKKEYNYIIKNFDINATKKK